MTAPYGIWPVQWTLAGTTFNGGTDLNGNTWWVTEEQGWSGSPSPRTGRTDRPWTQGQYRIPNYNSSRIISLSGRTVCQSLSGRRLAEHQLAQLCWDPTLLYTLSCTEETGILSAQVERDAATQVVIDSGGLSLTWSLQLAAPDPRKYATTVSGSTGVASQTGGLSWPLDWTGGGAGGLNWGTVTSTGTITLTNSGTADTWPVITFAANGGTIVNPAALDANGNLLSFNLTLSGTDQLVLTTNPIGRTVLLNGADRRSAMTSAQWFSIYPGSTDPVSFTASSTSGSPLMTISYAPAYW